VLRLYDVLVSAVVLLVLAPFELLRIALSRARRRDLEERLSGAELSRARRPNVLVHAVSAGEVAAAGALVERLAERAPDLAVVLTTANAAGRRAAERLADRAPNVAAIAWLPWDRARVLKRWLESFSPSAIVVVETEIWPGLFRAAKELGIPLLVANGRVYPKDVPRYRLAPGFFAGVLDAAAWIGAQNEAERVRFLAIGAPPERVEAAGSLKYDARIPPPERIDGWSGPVLVAGSTHAPEEELVLGVVARLRREQPDLSLIVAPRDPSRARSVAARARRHGLKTALYPEETARGKDVLVVAEVGYLPGLWAAADVALVGGSFASFGGHNPLEPAARGKAVVIGPHVAHVEEDVRRLADAGGLEWIREREGLPGVLEESLRALFLDRPRREEMGRRAAAAVQGGSGAASRTVERLLELVRR
jgi:3-deoxy-D-manno-octulosonic-acid transferase